MKNSWSLGYFIFTFLLSSSCDHGSDEFSIIETSSDFDYYAIEVFDNKLYVAGGEVWKQCDLSISSNGIDWVKGDAEVGGEGPRGGGPDDEGGFAGELASREGELDEDGG